jgi:two-component system, OmpR family, sensor histidine kinase BaeS
MKRAFPWLLTNILMGFLIFLVVQILILGIGSRVVLANYAENQREKLEEIARNILVNPGDFNSESLSFTNPFFVFSADKNLIFTNRGKGKSIRESEYYPVRFDGKTIGYYHAGELRFQDTEANRIFLTSLTILGAASIFISLLIGFVIAVTASRKIALPVSEITWDIHRIEKIQPVGRHEFKISELTEISAALENLSSILSNAEEYKRQWMQDIAHDLRTPIAGLKGQIEGMRDGVLETTTERFDKNLLEIDRLQDLVNAISDLYTIENIEKIEIVMFPAAEFVRDLLVPFEIESRNKKLKVTSRIAVDKIEGQRDLLLRGIGNIVANAFLYVHQKGCIDITLSEEGGGYQMRVFNDGPGIEKDNLDKIFNRFYRGEYARSNPGTGLGLNIAREIIKRHQGEIKVENVDPKGVCFTVLLPKSQTDSIG